MRQDNRIDMIVKITSYEIQLIKIDHNLCKAKLDAEPQKSITVYYDN